MRLAVIAVAVASLEPFAEVILILAQVDIILVTIVSASIRSLVAIIILTAITPVVDTGLISLLIAKVDSTPDQIEVVPIKFMVSVWIPMFL